MPSVPGPKVLSIRTAEHRELRLRTCTTCGHEFRGISRKCPSCIRLYRPIVEHHLGDPLTHREEQISGLVARAMSNKEIAFELHLAEGTIKEYLHVIFKKTGARSRVELALAWQCDRCPNRVCEL